MLIEGSEWFEVDHGHLGFFLKDVKKNYKKWSKQGKTLSSRLKKNFSYDAMKSKLIDILDKNVSVPSQTILKLPEIKGVKLPTLK